MKYFCSCHDSKGFFNGIFETHIDPYEDIEGFLRDLTDKLGSDVVLLFYKRVKS